MPTTDFLITPPANGTFQVALVLLVGLFMGLWATVSGKDPREMALQGQLRPTIIRSSYV